MNASGAPQPLLWQLKLSHYSEKVRWALDFKRIDHRRRSSLPGLHMPLALWLSRGAGVTLPILELGEERADDSSAAIEALERRFPAPPLYPAAPEQRRRALELERHFDQELGPHTRFLVFNELGRDPEILAELAARAVPPALDGAKPLLGVYARLLTRLRYGVADDSEAELARAKILAALDRIEAELEAGDGGRLVGEGFSVADLTAASLFMPLVSPEGGPLGKDFPQPPPLARFTDSIRNRPAFRWVEETYRRHRFSQPAAGAPVTAAENG